MRRIAIALVLLLAAGAAAGVARPEGARAVDAVPGTDSVTVGGTGTVTSVPVRARLSLGVDTRGDTARAALAANARAMRNVIEAVKTAGGREVGTQAVGLSQTFGQNGEISGYAASNVVTTTIGIDRAGTVIDAAVEAGANQISGPSPSVADQAARYREALQAAVADARARAQTLAAAAGRTLGKVTSMSEGGAPPPTPLFQKAASADAAGTPVEAGVQETTASVTVTFALGA